MIARGARPARDVEGAAQQRLVVGAMGCGRHGDGSTDGHEGLTRKSRAAGDALTPQIIAASSFDTSAAPATVAQNYGVRNTREETVRLSTPPPRNGADAARFLRRTPVQRGLTGLGAR